MQTAPRNWRIPVEYLRKFRACLPPPLLTLVLYPIGLRATRWLCTQCVCYRARWIASEFVHFSSRSQSMLCLLHIPLSGSLDTHMIHCALAAQFDSFRSVEFYIHHLPHSFPLLPVTTHSYL